MQTLDLHHSHDGTRNKHLVKGAVNDGDVAPATASGDAARREGGGAIVSGKRSPLDEVRAEAMNCQRCDLWRHATQTVFGEGPTQKPLMLVGEQPGEARRAIRDVIVGTILDGLRATCANRINMFGTHSSRVGFRCVTMQRSEPISCRWISIGHSPDLLKVKPPEMLACKVKRRAAEKCAIKER